MIVAMLGAVGIALAVWQTNLTGAQSAGLLTGLIAMMVGCWLMGAGTAIEAR